MHKQGSKLVRLLAVAATAAMLLSALPAGMATAANDKACKVYNADKKIGRSTLQRAVWKADPGDHLYVTGTCVGTTVVRKDLVIGWVQTGTSGKPRIVSGSKRPALVVDPRVDDLTILDGLNIIGGIVIGDVTGWQASATKAPLLWRVAAPSLTATLPSSRLRDCHVRNDETGAEYRRSQPAIRAASAGDRLSLRGKCGNGPNYVKRDLSIVGWRIAISGALFGKDGKITIIGKDDSGPATLKRLTVDDDVDSFVLKRVRVTKGFSIRDLAP